MERIRLPGNQCAECCLNPCFNGIQMELLQGLIGIAIWWCLNPCFNGIQMELRPSQRAKGLVCLNPCFNGIQMERYGIHKI